MDAKNHRKPCLGGNLNLPLRLDFTQLQPPRPGISGWEFLASMFGVCLVIQVVCALTIGVWWILTGGC